MLGQSPGQVRPRGAELGLLRQRLDHEPQLGARRTTPPCPTDLAAASHTCEGLFGLTGLIWSPAQAEPGNGAACQLPRGPRSRHRWSALTGKQPCSQKSRRSLPIPSSWRTDMRLCKCILNFAFDLSKRVFKKIIIFRFSSQSKVPVGSPEELFPDSRFWLRCLLLMKFTTGDRIKIPGVGQCTLRTGEGHTWPVDASCQRQGFSLSLD